MPRLLRLTLTFILLAAWGHLSAPSGFSQATLAEDATPASAAEQVRSLLSQAQLAIIGGAETGVLLAQAQTIYERDLKPRLEGVAQSTERIEAAFSQANTALAQGNSPLFATAQVDIWTALLGASYLKAEAAVSHADANGTRQWLALREFRQATRFSRPDADATLAVAALGRGDLSPDLALQAVRADLLDTYQARMEDALRLVPEAHSQGFLVRLAQQTSLASGYFEILSVQYSAQNGAESLSRARAAFGALKQVGLEGKDPTPYLDSVEQALEGFRAAPFTEEELARRAGQLLRYLSLVPMEYGRGVSDGRVTRDLEIQEAITFHTGATAALADLRASLQTIDAVKTAEIERLMHEQTAMLNAAGKHTAVAAHAEVEGITARITALLNEIMPTAWKQASSSADLDVIASVLDQMEAAVASGDYELAESARLEAYAILEVGPEARLRVFAPQLALQLENLFWYGSDSERGLAYLISNHAHISQVKATRAMLDARLAEAIEVVKGNNAPFAVATNAAIIVFREGLEAVLIFASLLGSLKVGANRRFRKPLWWGVALSMIAIVLTWVLARNLLTSLARYGEALEAVVSLVSIAVLLLITNWFFHKVYWTGWIASFHAHKKRLIGGDMGQMLGLVALGFTSIYREGFETVLFLQALVLEGGVGSVLAGIGIGLAGTILIGIIVLALQAKLPYKRMLVVTGVMIGAVLLVMVGNTTHVMQVVGWLPAHTIPGIDLPYWVGMWLGVYPTWEGIFLQIAAGTFVIGSYFLAERQKDRKAQPMQPKPTLQAIPASSTATRSNKPAPGK
ncbi:MAG: FTR1 family protein [Chloroflexia bacterium]